MKIENRPTIEQVIICNCGAELKEKEYSTTTYPSGDIVISFVCYSCYYFFQYEGEDLDKLREVMKIPGYEYITGERIKE